MERPVLKRTTAILLICAAGATSCASREGAPSAYPRRASGCDIALYHTSVPGAAVWDDLGVAEIACHVSSPIAQCLQMLKAEGCRLGGDMIYNIPRSPLRPSDQVMVFRGQVAHTRAGAPKQDEDADLPPPASAAEAAQPVIPLTGPAAPK
ncbi:MAG TPA: hypothetical protein VGP07_08380 [Polyangia bacterium]|jgi:hypothetical protein